MVGATAVTALERARGSANHYTILLGKMGRLMGRNWASFQKREYSHMLIMITLTLIRVPIPYRPLKARSSTGFSCALSASNHSKRVARVPLSAISLHSGGMHRFVSKQE